MKTASVFPTEAIPANHILLAQDERPRFVRLIRSGIVQLVHSDKGGGESILGLRSEGWWAGGTLAALGLPSLCSFEALTPCTFSSLPVSDFIDTLMKNQRSLRHFLASQARELLMVQQHSIMQGSSAEERLRYLQGESSQSIWATVDPTLVMRQGDIARLLSISPEHLCRLLRKEHPERRRRQR